MAAISIVTLPKPGGDGTLPLYVRVEQGGETRCVSLGIRIKERHWNAKGQEVRKSHPDFNDLRKHLNQVRADAESVVMDLVARRVPITAARLKAGIKARLNKDEKPTDDSQDFLKYAEAVLNDYRLREQIATFKGYQAAINKLAAYAKSSDMETIRFDDITVEFMRGFRTYLLNSKKNSTNTANKTMVQIRTILYQAIREERFPQEKNPFFQIRMKGEKVQKGKLSPEEIEKIVGLELEEGSLAWHVRNYWLFAFYAGGMRFSDVALLKWGHVRKGRLRYKMKKTAEGAGVPLVPQALEILSHYEDRKTGKEAFVFPILDGADMTTALGRHNAINSKNVLVNKYLKQIQEKAKIETKLSFHLSRHSLAHYLLSKGWDVYRIKEVLGHATVKVTETYLKGFDMESLDEDYRSAFD